MSRHYPLEHLFGRILSPFEEFLARTTTGGIVLMVTTALTLLLANVLGGETLHHVWDTRFRLGLGDSLILDMSLHHWVNDGLMTLFFLIVGLELKREIMVGELASLKDAMLPVVAALGGMIVPAGLFALLNHDTDTLRGWGIPMATDIAFAIGILVLLGHRVPRNLIIFLTALAIADDLGAVLVIALFYTQELRLDALFAAGTITALLFLLNRGGIRAPLPYWLLGTLLWLAFLASGIHATIAGVVLAFMIPARPKYTAQEFDTRLEELRDAMREESLNDSLSDAFSDHRLTAIAESAEQAATRVQSPLQRIEHGLNPWVTYLVIPIFALSNAGIDFAEFDLGGAFASPLTQGILLGLVLGKFLGITLFSYAAVTLGLGRLPTGVSWMQLAGAGWLGGIGFTMSLFIGQLAFDDPQAINLVKLGVLGASVISAVVGVSWLLWAARGKPAR